MVAAPTIQTEVITLDEYIQHLSAEPYEVIHGERVFRMANITWHGLVIKLLMRFFFQYELSTQAGEAFSEIPYVVTYKSNWVKGALIPDVMYFSAERLAAYREQYPEWRKLPFILIPDLAIEVVSPTDLYSEIQDKVEIYLRDGVKLIWIIDPNRKRAVVYEGQQQQILSEADTLTGGAVVPNLAIPVHELFL